MRNRNRIINPKAVPTVQLGIVGTVTFLVDSNSEARIITKAHELAKASNCILSVYLSVHGNPTIMTITCLKSRDISTNYFLVNEAAEKLERYIRRFNALTV